MKILIPFFIFLFLTACSSDESKKTEQETYVEDTNLVCKNLPLNEYSKDRFIFKINVERENFALFYTLSDGTDSWFRWGTDGNQLALPYCCAKVTTSHILLNDDYYEEGYFLFNRETLELGTMKSTKRKEDYIYSHQCRIVSETESKALRELKIKEKLEQYNKEKALEEEQKKKNKI